MKKFRQFFEHNIQWKLIALLIAFIIWLAVVNSSNPQVNGSVTIPFDVLNEQALITSSQIYTLSSDTITVSYTVRQKFLNLVKSDAFTAYINLEDYSVTGAVPVYLEIDSSVSELITDVRINPSLIHVYTESIQQKRFTIEPFVTGDVADGYIAGEAVVTPEYIYVKGPVSVMGQISGVGIVIDAEGRSENMEGTTSVVFLDANRNILSGIEENLSFAGDISYRLPIYRIKPLSVNAFTGGAPASGYTIDSVETSPTFISVYGPEEILNKYSYILIPGSAINVNGINENKTFNINATPYIPEGLKLAGQTPEITVYVKVRSIYDTSVSETTEAVTIPMEPATPESFSPEQESTEASSIHAESTHETDSTETVQNEHSMESSDHSIMSESTGEENSGEGSEDMEEHMEETLPAAEG